MTLTRAAVAVALTWCLAGPALAQGPSHPFGLGLQLGHPSGITAKGWFDERDALQVTAGWYGFGRGGWGVGAPGPQLGIDWTHVFARIRPRKDSVRFNFHIGAGGGGGWAEGNCYDNPWGDNVCVRNTVGHLYVRMPLGFSAYWPGARIELYAEIAPGVELFGLHYLGPAVFGDLGFRFYF
jgi:hypothetical protein